MDVERAPPGAWRSTALVPRVERRLAAILAADVAGYSRLMEADETGTFARLKRLRTEIVEPILAQRGGHVVDLKGDGAIVEFASAVDAVEAAVAVQRTMVAAEADLPEDRKRPTAFGSDANGP